MRAFFTNRLSGTHLCHLAIHVIAEVEKCGLQVVWIVTDNRSIYVTMMRHLGSGSLKPVVTHPCDAESRSFLPFDQCHMLQSVRSL